MGCSRLYRGSSSELDDSWSSVDSIWLPHSSFQSLDRPATVGRYPLRAGFDSRAPARPESQRAFSYTNTFSHICVFLTRCAHWLSAEESEFHTYLARVPSLARRLISCIVSGLR